MHVREKVMREAWWAARPKTPSSFSQTPSVPQAEMVAYVQAMRAWDAKRPKEVEPAVKVSSSPEHDGFDTCSTQEEESESD